MEEKIIETKICKHCQMSFDITDQDMGFYDKISPTFDGKKYQIPTPTFCPDCRLQRRMSRRNEGKLYKRKCDLTGVSMVSIYSPDKPYKVYESKARRGDQYDPMRLENTFDFTKKFMEQFDALLKDVPMQTLYVNNSTNSEYCNHNGNAKNCYMNIASRENEDAHYMNRSLYCKDCCDCLMCDHIEHSYQCIDSSNGYKTFFCQQTNGCSDSLFLYACEGCNFCFMCSNLKNLSYCIRNKQYTKEQYLEEMKKIDTSNANTLKTLQDEFTSMKLVAIHKYGKIINCEDSSGDCLINTKNCKHCFNVYDDQDCKYIENSVKASDAYDGIGIGDNGQLGYEFLDSGQNQTRTLFIFVSRDCSDIYYCFNCHNCHYCFGCSGLKNKEYCIFNRQYTKAEYEQRVSQIVEHMIKTGERGEFFQANKSPFGYNETAAIEYIPLTKEQALAQGFNRSDYGAPFPQVEKILKADELPNIKDVTDDILQQAIICEVSGKPFRLIKSELDFCRKHHLPIPTQHPDVRHMARVAMRNPKHLRIRKCDKCGIDMQTTYAPDRPEKVYCEQCYNQEIYG